MTNTLTILGMTALCACLNRARGMKSRCAHLYGGVLAVVLMLFAWNGAALPPVLTALFILSVGFPLCVAAAVACRAKNPWALSEWFYGALQGLVIGVLITGGV